MELTEEEKNAENVNVCLSVSNIQSLLSQIPVSDNPELNTIRQKLQYHLKSTENFIECMSPHCHNIREISLMVESDYVNSCTKVLTLLVKYKGRKNANPDYKIKKFCSKDCADRSAKKMYETMAKFGMASLLPEASEQLFGKKPTCYKNELPTYKLTKKSPRIKPSEIPESMNGDKKVTYYKTKLEVEIPVPENVKPLDHVRSILMNANFEIVDYRIQAIQKTIEVR